MEGHRSHLLVVLNYSCELGNILLMLIVNFGKKQRVNNYNIIEYRLLD